MDEKIILKHIYGFNKNTTELEEIFKLLSDKKDLLTKSQHAELIKDLNNFNVTQEKINKHVQ